MADPETTDDRFLGGTLLLRQPKRGHRAGHDAMLLAASVAARPGQRAVDLGAGVGAAGLALAARVHDLDLTLLEIDPALSALAAHNAAANRTDARVVTANVADRHALPADAFDILMMNPPFHDAARHRASPDSSRERAHIASEDTLAVWIGAAHRLLKSNGTLTMIWRADGLSDVLAVLTPRFGGVEILPVHSTIEKPAVRILVRATKAGKAPLILHKGVDLDSDETACALRGEGVLTLASR